jgi:hypothetical protein
MPGPELAAIERIEWIAMAASIAVAIAGSVIVYMLFRLLRT